jgi:exosortase K
MKTALGRKIDAEKIVMCAVAITIAAALKYHYSRAGADDLLWILYPVSLLTRLLTGLDFAYQPGEGFVNSGAGIVIAPACAGVNFLIITFCTVFFKMSGRPRSHMVRFALPGAVLATSYLLTVIVNGVRIAIAVFLYTHDIHYGWLTSERLHHIEGVIVYFSFLALFYLATDRLVRDKRKKAGIVHPRFVVADGLFVPLAWYLLITVAIPLLNGGYRRMGPAFVEHDRPFARLDGAVVFGTHSR